jgi:hypothetical protein
MDSTELEPVAEDGNADDGEGTLEDEGGEADEVETAAPPAQNTRARTTRAPVAGKTAPAKQPAARQTRAPVKAAATTAAKVPAKAKVVVRQRRRAVR